MKQESTVDFAGLSRIHIGLGVHDLAQSVDFYRILFGQNPTKTRDQYAKFEVVDPSVNLALNQVTAVARNKDSSVSHFGIQVKSREVVSAAIKRFREAGLETAVEESVTCCYAVQDKVWVTDPDGNKWEVFVVLEADAERLSDKTWSECCVSDQATECCTSPTVEGCC